MITKEELKKFLQEKIQEFKDANDYDSSEDQVQTHYTIPLLAKLGWTAKNALIKKAQDVKNQRFPDITLQQSKRNLLIIESKTAENKNKLDGKYPKLYFVDQLMNYCEAGAIWWGVLTNFVEWCMYNRYTKRLYPDDKKYAFHDLLWKDADKNNYIDLMSEEGLDFLLSLSVETLESNGGLIDKKLIYYPQQNDLEEEKIKDDFFIKIKKWRNSLIKYIKHNFTSYSNVDILSQKILDRIIFMAICSDKQIIGYNPLLEVLQCRTNKYTMLKDKFVQMDDIFNSELFDKSDVDNLKISDDILVPIIEELKDISFKKLSVHIIGEVYENFLGELQRGSDDEKAKSKRKIQGIYYTQQFIVKYIVKKTVGELLKNVKTEEELEKIKVIDIACGSGSFLIGVFDEFMEAYKRINKGETIFDFAKKKKILQNNIYGIDLDSKAIEIAKLNLMVKALDGMTTNDLKGKHLLPNLNLNIRVGNSVVNVESDMFNDYSDKINEIIDAKQKFYANEDYEISQKLLQNIFVLENFVNNKLIETSGIKNPEHIKPLNFSVIFCEVFKNGGFDAVVGNPPYLREKGHKKVFDIIKLGEYKKYLQGKMDYWYLFLRRAIDITKKEGKVGFITNSYFLKGSGASELIEKIKSDTVLNNAIDFDDIKIFGNVNGKHIIHTYIKKTPERSDKTEYTEIDKIQFNKFAPAVVGTIQKIPYLKIFDGAKISFDIDVVDYTKYKELGEFYEISQGVIEGSDKVSSKNNKKYKYNIGDGIFVLNSDELKMLNLQSDEKQFVKKYLDSKNVEKYKINFGKDYLLYITEDNCENVSKYKNIQNHLKKYKKIMDNRRETKKGTREWFQLHWSRESKFFDNPKLICMGMFNKPTFVYDDEKYYVGMSFSVIIQKDENYSLKYLLGILNSKFGEYWFNKHGKKRGVGVDIGVLVFRMFPICPASTEQQSKIEKIVNELTEIKAKITEDKKSNVKDKLELDFASKEIELNESIYTIYGFSPDEIDIIKEATK